MAHLSRSEPSRQPNAQNVSRNADGGLAAGKRRPGKTETGSKVTRFVFPERIADRGLGIFAAPKSSVDGKLVGQEECLMQDAGVVDLAKKYHRVGVADLYVKEAQTRELPQR